MEKGTEFNVETKRKIWQGNWAYAEGFIIALGLLVIGFLLEYITGGAGVKSLRWPVNLVVLLVLINGTVLVYSAFKNNKAIYWLSTIPAAITSIVLVTFLTMLLGSIKQDDSAVPELVRRLGLSHFTSSYPFLLAMFYFLTVLGFVTVRRAFPFRKRNIGFLINHFGLWLIIASMALGAGDLTRVSMSIRVGEEFKNTAYDNSGNVYNLQTAFRLTRFQVNEYNPKLGLVDNSKMEFVINKKNNLVEISKGAKANFNDWKVEIVKFYPLAISKDSGFIESKVPGSAPVAYVKATNKNGESVTGWITCGSMNMMYKMLKINDNFSVAMSNPSPKSYVSDIEYVTMNKEKGFFTLEVNKPKTVGAWKIYQTGFNEELGRWSDESIIELVRDPWLPLIFTGFFLLIIGAVYIFWIGKDKKELKIDN